MRTRISRCLTKTSEDKQNSSIRGNVSKEQKRRDERLWLTRTPEPAFTLRHTNTAHLYCIRKREAVYIGGYKILPLGTVGDSPGASNRRSLQAFC